MNVQKMQQRITVPAILDYKANHQKITALTAYDYLTAKLIDRAGADLILVGDSAGTVVQGGANTLSVTLDEIIYHCRCVARGVSRALVIGDLPFMSYQTSPEKAIESAGRLVKEGQAAAVKLEGGLPMEETIRRIAAIDIPVVGHVGLTPQSYHRMGGHRRQGRRSGSETGGNAAGSRERIIADALAVERAGAFAVVLEGIPQDLAGEITDKLSIPTIGIGAGPLCDGQILVSSDMLGFDPDFRPAFAKRYADLAGIITAAVEEYCAEVRDAEFPPAKPASPQPHCSVN